jgi:hypothetical protein
MGIRTHSSRNLKCEERVQNVAGPSMSLSIFVIVVIRFEPRRLKKDINAKTAKGLNGIREPL